MTRPAGCAILRCARTEAGRDVELAGATWRPGVYEAGLVGVSQIEGDTGAAFVGVVPALRTEGAADGANAGLGGRGA